MIDLLQSRSGEMNGFPRGKYVPRSGEKLDHSHIRIPMAGIESNHNVPSYSHHVTAAGGVPANCQSIPLLYTRSRAVEPRYRGKNKIMTWPYRF